MRPKNAPDRDLDGMDGDGLFGMEGMSRPESVKAYQSNPNQKEQEGPVNFLYYFHDRQNEY